MTALLKTHKAILNSTTMYLKNINDPKHYKFKDIEVLNEILIEDARNVYNQLND